MLNTKTTTPPSTFFERLVNKVAFSVKGNEKLIFDESRKGVVIKIDETLATAIACFDNLHDYNDFKKLVA